MTRTWTFGVVLAVLLAAGCGSRHRALGESQSLTPERAAAVVDGVQGFMRVVAQGVTKDGPSAWRKYFEDSPAFFMAADGSMAFPNSAAATAAIADLARNIKQINLQWGDDLRVDPLTRDLAVVASSWHEVRVNTAGERVEEKGFFTAIAEFHDGRWQFRDAHWSVAAPPPATH